MDYDATKIGFKKIPLFAQTLTTNHSLAADFLKKFLPYIYKRRQC